MLSYKWISVTRAYVLSLWRSEGVAVSVEVRKKDKMQDKKWMKIKCGNGIDIMRIEDRREIMCL